MDDLGFAITNAVPWFTHDQEAPYVLIRVSGEHAKVWSEALAVAFRRCYVTDDALHERSVALAAELKAEPDALKAQVLASKLPDPGSTMAGDFGELLAYIYQAAKEHPRVAFGPKKWRLKQDRTKPAPRSDVVHFILPSWPKATGEDQILCAEVKTKSTQSAFSPIKQAIADSAKDRTSRLAATLVWLRERAMGESLGTVEIAHLNRFINATDYPHAIQRFRAVAVVCSSLVEGELKDAPNETPDDHTVVVISVPELKSVYTSVFAAIQKSIEAPLNDH